MLRMTLLGVGTAVPDQDRENTHMVWEGSDGLLTFREDPISFATREIDAGAASSASATP